MATESLSWADSVWGHRCDGNCADGRGRSIIADGETYQGGFQVSQHHSIHGRKRCLTRCFFRVVNATDKACGSGQTVLRTMGCTIMTYDMGASTFFCFFSLSFCHFSAFFPIVRLHAVWNE